jgi:DNA-binding protein H-NS
MFGKAKNPLENQTFDQLLTQKLAVDDELGRRSDTELAVLKEKLALIAEFRGLEIEEVLKEPKRKREVKIRYMNPENPDETWSGMGKPKKWLQEKLDAGARLEDYAVI